MSESRVVFESYCSPADGSECETCGYHYPSLDYEERSDGTFELRGSWGCFEGAFIRGSEYDDAISVIDDILRWRDLREKATVLEVRTRLRRLRKRARKAQNRTEATPSSAR